jgi:head-tail adaptor
MRLGDLNRNLIFQAPTKDANGVVGWQTIFTAKGAWWPLTSVERIQALALGGTITGKVRIRYRPVRILVTWRILVNGVTVLNIAAPPINLSGKNEWMEIQIREVA